MSNANAGFDLKAPAGYYSLGGGPDVSTDSAINRKKEREKKVEAEQAKQKSKNIIDRLVFGEGASRPTSRGDDWKPGGAGQVTGTDQTNANVQNIINGGETTTPPSLNTAKAAYEQAEQNYNTAMDALKLTMQNTAGDVDYDKAVQGARDAAKQAEDNLRQARADYESLGGLGRSYSGEDRASDTIKGAEKSSAASAVDAFRALWEKGAPGRAEDENATIADLDANLDRLRSDYSKALLAAGGNASDPALRSLYEKIQKEQAFRDKYAGITEGEQALVGKAANKADELLAGSSQDIARAKNEASKFTQGLVDVGVAGTQLATDAAISAMTGIPTTAVIGIRSFGGGTQKARLEGGDIDQQLAYGAASAAVEMLTEKMADGLAGITGKGMADDVAEEVIRKLADTDLGRTALRAIYSMGGEASEEIVSSAVDPALRSIYNGKSVGENYSEENIADWLYDGLIGGILGGAGAIGSITTGQNAAKNADLRLADAGLGSVDSQVNDAMAVLEGKRSTKAQQGREALARKLLGLEPQQEAAPAALSAEQPKVPTNPPVSVAEETQNNHLLTEADLDDYLKVGEREHVRNKKKTMLENGKSPILTSIASIRDYIKSSLAGNNKNEIVAYGKVGNRLVTDIAREAQGKGRDVNVNGYYLELDANRLHHINDHIDADPDGRNVPLSESKIEHLTEYIDSYDNVLDVLTRKDGSTRVYLSKATPDGHVVIVELVSKGRSSLQPVTAWENTPEAFEKAWGTKKAPSTSVNGDVDKSATLRQPQSGQDASSSVVDIIPQNTSDVNIGAAENLVPIDQVAETMQSTAESTNGTGPMRERGGSANIRTNENAEPDLRQSFEVDPSMYNQLTNAEVKAKADEIIAKGFDTARSEVEKAIGEAKAGRKLSPAHLVAGFEVANELTRRGDVDAANRLMADIFAEQTAAGQLGQLGRLLRQNSPAVKSMTINNIVEKMNNALTKGQQQKNMMRGRGDAEGRIQVDPALVEQFANAQTDAETDAAMDAIMDDIAAQVPATFTDKFTALRYLNMLGNIKTQGRNIVGNTAMMIATDVKRAVQAVNELAASAISGGKFERNTSLFTSKELRQQAREDFDANIDYIKGDSKYSEASRKALQGIQDRRTIFGSGKNSKWASSALSSILGKNVDVKKNVIENARLLTNWAMDAGDVIFMKHTYTQAFAGWMKAHGIDDVSTATTEQLSKAREFAAKEAQEATFHDNNAVSNWVSGLGRGENTPAVVNTLMEGVLPFRKTPANVGVRAIEYSPVGVAETIVKGVQALKGNASGADVINSLSKNVTGTALAIAGYFLAAAGQARASGSDDDELNNFQKMNGASDYSVNIGGKNVSLSQFAPMAVPFFMGVRLNELLESADEPLSLDNIGDILGVVTDPMLEMSMLSGVNELLNNIAALKGDADAVPVLVANAGISYLSQILSNTLLGQAEQASEENRQTIYTDTKSEAATPIDQFLGKYQYTVGKNLAKIPGVDYHQEDYIDAWGRTQSNGGVGERLFNAFINPTYMTGDRSTAVDAELERLYSDNKDVEGFPDVLPQKRARSAPIGDGIVMTPEQYHEFSINSGQKKLELVSDFMESEQYKGLNDQERAEIIKNLYSFAEDQALQGIKESYGVETDSDWQKLLNGQYEANGNEKRPPLQEKNIVEYVAFYTAANDAFNSNDYNAITNLYEGFSKLDKNTQDVLIARDGDVGQMARLIAGTDKPGTSDDIPALDPKNAGLYASYTDKFGTAVKDLEYSLIDDAVSQYASLPENVQTVLAAKDPNGLNNLIELNGLGVGSQDWYTYKGKQDEAQEYLDVNSDDGTTVKFAAVAAADLPEETKAALIGSNAVGLSKTARGVYEVLSERGYDAAQVYDWLMGADYTYSKDKGEYSASGTLSGKEVAAAVNKMGLPKAEANNLYEALESVLGLGKSSYDQSLKTARKETKPLGREVDNSELWKVLGLAPAK